MKKSCLILCLIVCGFKGFSQEIKFNKDIVLVDEKECLKIDDSDSNSVSILDLEGNEIVFLRFIHNSRYGALYNKITFVNQKVTMTSQSYIFTKKLLIKKLIADKTLVDCKLDDAKVEKFIMKYDENVERD